MKIKTSSQTGRQYRVSYIICNQEGWVVSNSSFKTVGKSHDSATYKLLKVMLGKMIVGESIHVTTQRLVPSGKGKVRRKTFQR